MALFLLIYIVAIIYAFYAPSNVRIIIFILSIIIPDPLPFLEEVLLLIAILKSDS